MGYKVKIVDSSILFLAQVFPVLDHSLVRLLVRESVMVKTVISSVKLIF